MAPTKKRASRVSPKNTGKKKAGVTETPAKEATPKAAPASSSASITVANKEKGPSSIADSEEPSSSPLSTPSESPQEPPSLTSDAEPDQQVHPEPKAKEVQPPWGQLAAPSLRPPQHLMQPPNYAVMGDTPMPDPPLQRPAQFQTREQVVAPFTPINGAQVGSSGSNNAIVIDDSDEAGTSNTASKQLQVTNGHAGHPSNADAGLPVSPRGRIEAVRIPPYDPTAGNPVRNTAGYEYSNLEEITIRQLREDIHAYNHDRQWCEDMLRLDDISPAEARTYQLRILDISHQIRSCNHRIENLELQMRRTMPLASRTPQYSIYNTNQRATAAPPKTNGHAAAASENRAVTNGTPNTGVVNGNATRGTTPSGQASGENPLKRGAAEMSPARSDSAEYSYKRQRLPMTNTIPVDPIEFDQDADLDEVIAQGPILAVQRLGFWKCHLCHTPKYLLAPVGKSPAAPTKWALKDISKMITHFCVMHSEQTVADRLSELGQAFELNRGPFQYWLKTTKNARLDAHGNIEGGSSIDEIIETLKAGRMPMALRRFSNSAKKMITE
ncbi:hypothetical protein V8F20_004133 [Naviculisporaceae sp. PSN 640]